MLYQLRTNPRIGFSLVSECADGFIDLPLSDYEQKSEPIVNLSSQTMKVAHLPHSYSPPSFIREFATQAHSRGRAVTATKIPDFWSTNPLPTVSDRLRVLIEDLDPGVHRFVPIVMRDRVSGEVLADGAYHLLLCGRLVEIDPAINQVSKDNCDVFGFAYPSTQGSDNIEARIYQTIVSDTSIHRTLSEFPLWRFNTRSIENFPFGCREILYSNARLVKAAQALKLRGFNETKGLTTRDVNHVWY